ncbi:MAG: O-antigen ligase family protein [Patescibacteria group bacterium]
MTVTITKIRKYLFYLLLFLLPWQTRWIIRDSVINGEVWEYGRVSLYGWDILLVFLLVVCLPVICLKIKNLKFPSTNWRIKIRIFSQPFFYYFLLLFFTLTSLFWAHDKLLIWFWVARLLEVGLLWLIVWSIKPNLEKISLSLMAAGIVQAVWAIGQFAYQTTWASKWLGVAEHPLFQPGSSVVLASTGRWLRAYAGQVHPNVLGGLLVMTLLFTVYLLINNFYKAEYFKLRLGLLAFYVIQLGGLFFTFSRGAWLAWFISLIAWWSFIKMDRKILSKLGLTAALVFVVLGVVNWQPTVGRLLGGSRLEQQSVEERVGSIGDSRTILHDSWFQGVGLGNYTVKLQQYQPGLKIYKYQPVHNLWLLILTEIGFIGLVLWLVIWVLSWLSVKSIFIKLLSLPIIITGLVDHYWWTSASMFLLWWLLIILANIEDSKTEIDILRG